MQNDFHDASSAPSNSTTPRHGLGKSPRFASDFRVSVLVGDLVSFGRGSHWMLPGKDKLSLSYALKVF